MSSKKIVIISASSVKNLELALKFKTVLEDGSAHVQIININELDLPLFTSHAETKYNPQELLGGVIDDMREAQGFVFVSPEYNGSTPPAFPNFIAWVSRSSKEWRECFANKPAALGTFSGGGGFNVLLAMRTQLAFMGMHVLGRQVLTHSNKPLEEQSLRAVCDELIRLA